MKSVFWFAVLGLLINSTVWGLSWMPFRSLAQDGVHPLWATAIIYALGTVAVIVSRARALREFAQVPALLLLALAAGLTNALFNSAVAIGDVVRVVLLFYLMPVWTVLLARWLLDERFTTRALARVALGVGGAMMVLYDPVIGLPLPGWSGSGLADWMAIAGGMAFALNNVTLRRLSASSESARTIAMLAGGVLLAGSAGALLAVPGFIAWPTFSAPGTLSTLALWSVLFLLANMGLQYGAARLPANITAVVMLSEVLVATGSSWWAGTAELRMQDLIGGIMIIAAPFLFADRRARA